MRGERPIGEAGEDARRRDQHVGEQRAGDQDIHHPLDDVGYRRKQVMREEPRRHLPDHHDHQGAGGRPQGADDSRVTDHGIDLA
jgi:hypothetical protein